nr:MAG TPA: hypothetical protein [Caudoviricetes sp.]
METGRKASRVYEGMREDEKEQKVPVPSKGKVDNSRGPLGYSHGKGEEDKEHGPGVGLKRNAADNSPSPVPRKR